jgi:hypothetical protein
MRVCAGRLALSFASGQGEDRAELQKGVRTP